MTSTPPLKSAPRHQLLINLLLLLSVGLTACGGAPEQAPTVVDEAVVTNTPPVDPILQVKANYQKIERLFSNAQLQMDSIQYDCDEGSAGGKIDYFRYEGALRLIRHSYYTGDHEGALEYFYLYPNGNLCFVHTQESNWQFDPDFADDNTETPATIDRVKELRHYYKSDTAADLRPATLQSLTKSYVIRSAQDFEVNPNEIPNEPGNPADAVAAADRFLTLLEVNSPAAAQGLVCR